MKNLSYGRQDINEADIQAVVDVLRGDWLTMGPGVKEFEEALASYVGVKHAVTFSSGTAALHGAMYAAGLKPGDFGVTTPLTFTATANSIAYTGAMPLFADIDPDTLCLDPEKAGELVANPSVSHRVKAVVPVSFAGYPFEIGAFRDLAARTGAVLIEDASHSLGGGRGTHKIGFDADMTTLSFHPVKHITTAEGGAVLTSNDEYAKRLRLFRNHGTTRDAQDFIDEPAGVWHSEMQFLGYNYRLSEVACALGNSQLKRLDEFVAKRRHIAGLYRELLGGVEGLELPPDKEGHAYHLFVLQVDEDKQAGLFNHLKANGINPQVHYRPVHLQPYYRQRWGYCDGDFPFSERYYKRAMSLPIFNMMDDDDVRRAAGVIKEFMKQ